MSFFLKVILGTLVGVYTAAVELALMAAVVLDETKYAGKALSLLGVELAAAVTLWATWRLGEIGLNRWRHERMLQTWRS